MDDQITALLLAAGFGTRLKPLTDNLPKCLVEVGGSPILYKWLKKVDSINCSEIIVNTHYLSEKVEAYLKSVKGINARINICHEDELKGTAGTLLDNSDYFYNTTGIMVHVDNMSDINLSEIITAHQNRPKECILTMLTFETENPSSCGIVEVNSKGIVTSFHEKVENPPGNKANGAVYVFEPSLFREMEKMNSKITDFSLDVLPNLVGRMFTWHTNKPYIDIGTPNSLEKARKLWAL